VTYTTQELSPHKPNWANAGTVSLFEREGFVLVGRPSAKYVVMQREV
jgi:hypothetical protein